MGRERGQQLKICHRERQKTQSPHPRSLASQPNQTNRTLRQQEQDGGRSWRLGRDCGNAPRRRWAWTRRKRRVRRRIQRGEKYTQPVLCSLSSETTRSRKGPLSATGPREAALVACLSFRSAWNGSKPPRGRWRGRTDLSNNARSRWSGSDLYQGHCVGWLPPRTTSQVLRRLWRSPELWAPCQGPVTLRSSLLPSRTSPLHQTPGW